MAASADGTTLYAVGPQPGTTSKLLVVANTSDLTQRQTFVLPSGAGPVGVSTTTGNVYVSLPGNTSVEVFIPANDGTAGDLSAGIQMPDSTAFKNWPGDKGTIASLTTPDAASNGSYTYAVNGTTGTLTVTPEGSATAQQTLQDNVGGVRGLTGATGIAISQDGSYVYVTSGSGDSLAIFGVLPSGNLQLDQVIHGGPGLDDPTSVAVVPADSHYPADLNVYVSSLLGTGTTSGGLASFTVVSSGPVQPNTLSINYSAMWGLNLTTGSDDDTISEISPATVSDLNVNAGDGNNTVAITDWNNFTSVTTGSGADNVLVHSSTTKQASSPIDVANNPNAVATQSSTLAPIYSAGNAIDGDDGTFSLTDDAPNSYWQDALGGSYLLTSLSILFSEELSAPFASNFRVSVLDNGVETFGQDYYQGSGGQPAGVPLVVALPSGIIGDTIKIQLLGLDNIGAGYLGIAEVQAFATAGLSVSTGAGDDYVNLVNTSSGDNVGINEGTGDDTLQVSGQALNLNSTVSADGGSAPRPIRTSTRFYTTPEPAPPIRQCLQSPTAPSRPAAETMQRSTT